MDELSYPQARRLELTEDIDVQETMYDEEQQ